MAFVAIVAAVLCLNLAAGNPHGWGAGAGAGAGAGSWGSGSGSDGGWGSGSGSGAGWGSGSGAGGAGGGAGGAGHAGADSKIIIEQPCPSPIVVGLPLTPNVIDHQSAPYEINYFGTPYVVKTKQSAALNVYTQTPVVVDTYAEPQIHELCAPPAIIVEEVCPCPGQ